MEDLPEKQEPSEQGEANKITPEAIAALIAQIKEAIVSIGDKYIEAKRLSNRNNTIFVMLAIFVVFTVFMVIYFNKVTEVVAGFLLGSIITGTFTVLADIWRRH